MKKAWLAGVLVTVVVCGLFLAGSTLALIYILRSEADSLPEEPRDVAAEQDAKSQAESAQKIEELGLDKIYTPVYLFYSEHEALYHERDFAGVESRLLAARDKATTPFERYRYGSILNDLGNLRDEDGPEFMIAAADAWVEASPDAYLPLLIRGKLFLSCAWHYRGDGYVDEVSSSGWKKYHSFSEKAWDDLIAAQKIYKDDAEIPATMVNAAAGIGEGLATIRRCYDETIALNPHHVGVRYTMLNYLRPVWFGSWEAMDAFYAENESAIAEFPYLYSFYWGTSSYMEERGAEYEGIWESPEMLRDAAAAYGKQAELTPEEPIVLADAAYFAARAGDMASATTYYERIGNRYPVTSYGFTLYNYHWWRLYALVEHSDDPGVIGTPREKELLDKALALEPSHSGANGHYLALLARSRDDALTTSFWATLGDELMKTGTLGDPPDYAMLEAMSLAARSDDHGIKGSEEEAALLAQALAQAPDNPYIRLMYAEHFISAKEYDQARPHLERAREIAPDYLPALHIMGWLNYHQKRWDEGIATATAFLAAGPSTYVTAHTEDAQEIIELCEKKKLKAAAG